MRAILTIAWNDIFLYFQDRSNYVFVFIMPIIFVFVIGSVFAPSDGGETYLRMDVVDEDGSPAAAQLVAALLDANPTVIVCPAADANAGEGESRCGLDANTEFTAELAQERLVNLTTYATLTIPAGYGESLAAGDPVTLTFRSDPSLEAPQIAWRMVQAVLTRIGGATVAARLSTDAAIDLNVISEDARPDFYAARYAEAEASWGPPAPITIVTEAAQAAASEEGSSNNGFSGGFKQSSPGMAAMFAMINVVGLAATLVQERQDGTLPRLIVMPVTRAQILAGKVLRGYVLGLIQFAILLVVGSFLGVNFGQNLLAVVLTVLAFVLAVSAMAIAFSTIARTPEQASGFAMLASMTLAPLGGAWWPLEIVPDFMKTIGHISPVAWCMDAFNTILFDNGGVGDIIVPLLVLLGFSVVLFAFGIARFKYE